MDLSPFRPLRLSIDVERRLDEIFSELIHEPWGGAESRAFWQPDIDLYETDDAYLVEADLPGVLPKDLTVQIEGRSLTISGVRRSTSVVQSAQGVRLERKHGSFYRRFRLEHPVDADQTEIERDEGVYRIRLPKKRTRAQPGS